MDKIDIEHLKEVCNFQKSHILKSIFENRYDINSKLSALLGVVVHHSVFEKNTEYNIWLEKAKLYFGNFNSKDDSSDYEKHSIRKYYFYLSLFNQEVNYKPLLDYLDYEEDYYAKHYKSIKSNLSYYEELVIMLLLAKQYDKALDYCNNVCAIKPKGLVNSIKNYLVCKSNNSDTKDSIAEIKKELNKRRSALTHIITDGMAYFIMYYFEILNEQNLEKALRACYYGIDK